MTIELHHGDCLDIMPTLEAHSFDAIIADLPYGTTACKWDSVIPFGPLWAQYKRLIKERGAIVLFGSQPFTSALVMSNVKWFRYEWIWDKITARGHLVAKKRPMAQHENILVFYENAPTYSPQMIDRPLDKIEIRRKTEYKRTEICGGISHAPKNVVYDQWYPKTIITESNVSVKPVHPTQKPVALLEYLIKTYTNPGDRVLDNTMGSGTTMVACVNTGRNGVGIELLPVEDGDPDYFGIAQGRVEEAQNEMIQAALW